LTEASETTCSDDTGSGDKACREGKFYILTEASETTCSDDTGSGDKACCEGKTKCKKFKVQYNPMSLMLSSLYPILLVMSDMFLYLEQKLGPIAKTIWVFLNLFSSAEINSKFQYDPFSNLNHVSKRYISKLVGSEHLHIKVIFPP
jgi:hypothetical protein